MNRVEKQSHEDLSVPISRERRKAIKRDCGILCGNCEHDDWIIQRVGSSGSCSSVGARNRRHPANDARLLPQT